jgi:hypothetical protein
MSEHNTRLSFCDIKTHRIKQVHFYSIFCGFSIEQHRAALGSIAISRHVLLVCALQQKARAEQ